MNIIQYWADQINESSSSRKVYEDDKKSQRYMALLKKWAIVRHVDAYKYDDDDDEEPAYDEVEGIRTASVEIIVGRISAPSVSLKFKTKKYDSTYDPNDCTLSEFIYKKADSWDRDMVEVTFGEGITERAIVHDIIQFFDRGNEDDFGLKEISELFTELFNDIGFWDPSDEKSTIRTVKNIKDCVERNRISVGKDGTLSYTSTYLQVRLVPEGADDKEEIPTDDSQADA